MLKLLFASPRIFRLLILGLGLVAARRSQAGEAAFPARTFAEWRTACSPLPSNRELRGRLPDNRQLPLKNFAELGVLLDDFSQLGRTGNLSHAHQWLGTPPGPGFFARAPVNFEPFVERASVPAGSEIVFHGDLHGDIRSLLARLTWLNEQDFLRGFTLARTNTWMVFLGDYIDRGAYGIEVLYTVLRLKLANPERVILVRGNHEDPSLAARYGFFQEGGAKYGARFDAVKVAGAFDYLPVALYLGCGTNWLQCNHGGMEPGFDPGGLLEAPAPVRYQKLGALRQRGFVTRHPGFTKTLGPDAAKLLAENFSDFTPVSPTQPQLIGFMWNDFTVTGDEPPLAVDEGRGLVYGEGTTRQIFAASSGRNSSLRAVFRAHQHAPALNPMMRRLMASQGVFQHWQNGDTTPLHFADISQLSRVLDTGRERSIPPGSVWTFNVSPDSSYGAACGFDDDVMGILRVAGPFAGWRLRVVTLKK